MQPTFDHSFESQFLANPLNKWLGLIGLLLLSYFLVFHRLDVKAIHSWDEALFAARSFYMAHDGEYFTNWKNIDFCEIDHPNTKPPLITFIQALSLKVLGYNRLALRLPIALFGLATGLLLFYFGKKLRVPWAGLLACLALLTSWGYNQHHILRTGDQDTALAFWLLASLVCFLGFQFSTKRSSLYLVLFFVFTACAVLTKSVMGFILLPAVAVYVLFWVPTPKVFKNPWFYVGLLIMTLMVGSFYGLMEWRYPGFLGIVWDEEVGGRYVLSEDRVTQPWYFYLNYLVKEGIPFYWIPATIGLWLGLKSTDDSIKGASRLLGISMLVLLSVLGTTDTKLIWYAAPLYPILAFFTGLGIWHIATQWIGKRHPSLGWLFCALIMAWPTYQIIERNTTETTGYIYERYELYLEKLHKDRPELDHLRVHANNEWYPSFVFIGNKFKKKYGVQLDFITSQNEVYAGDLLFGAYHPRMDVFDMEVVQSFGPKGDVRLWQVLDVRNKD